MQLTLFLLVIGVLSYDTVAWPKPAPLQTSLFLLVLPKLLVAGLQAWACRRTLRGLATPSGHLHLARLGRFEIAYRGAVLLMFAADLWLGGLAHVRSLFPDGLQGTTGDPILLDECLFLLPTLLMFLWGWLVYYPVDRRIREALLIHDIDAGFAIHPAITRGEYLLNHVRHQMALVLIPMLLLLGWTECVQSFGSSLGLVTSVLLQAGGAVGLFLLAPIMFRHIWHTSPLPAGELRDHLLALCHRYRVGVRDLLLWGTFGEMVNAAVMGVVRPFRFILLTDGLLERLPLPEVEAVMAHEIAHVLKRHTLWLVLVAGTLIAGLSVTTGETIGRLPIPWIEEGQAQGMARNGAELLLVAAAWAIAFGWVSRRFERQADVFAVCHMADGQRIRKSAAAVMSGALERVAASNHIPETRRSWRHGSIAWRREYLLRMVGSAPDHPAIDRTVMRIKCVTVGALALLLAHYFLAA